jgi:hypothetical protein
MKTMLDIMREQRYDDKYITNATAGSQALTANDFAVAGKNGANFVYDGAGLTTVTLPTAVVGYSIGFEVRAAGGVCITPYSTEKINAMGAYNNSLVTSTTDGSRIFLSCEKAGYWTVLFKTGIWTNDLAISNSGATAQTITAEECTGQFFIYTGAGLTTATLPAAVVGMKIGFKVRAAGGVKVVPASGEFLAGVCTAAGAAVLGGYGSANQYVQNTTNGDMIIFECLTLHYWAAVGFQGVWVLAT